MQGNPINISLMQPSFYGVTIRPDPIYIWNTLTGEVYSYQKVQDLPLNSGSDSAIIPISGPGSVGFFSFDNWPPSIYEVANNSSAAFTVILFGKSYDVEPGTLWVFFAHDEISSHAAWQRSGTVSRIIPSIWDAGASIWDSGNSIWDVYLSQT